MAGVDYSKWDKFTDEDEDVKMSSEGEAAAAPAPATKKKAPKKTMLCGNCRAEGAKLRCTVCKKVAYCNRTCQKSDWRFHKRVCKKPEKKKKDGDKKAKKASTGSDSKAASAAAAPAADSSSSGGGGGAPKKAKKKATASKTQAELDAEDEEIVKSLKGYRYFHRDVSEHEAKIIGDTTPELLNASAAGDEDDPQPMATATATPSSLASASAWNTARTFEERDMTRWAKAHLETLLVDLTEDIADAQAVVAELADWEGDASIPVIRGRARFLYDFNFTAKFNIRAGSGDPKKASVKFVDFSQDEDEPRIEVSFQSPKPSALHQAAFRSVMEEGSGSLRAKLLAALRQFVVDYKAK